MSLLIEERRGKIREGKGGERGEGTGDWPCWCWCRQLLPAPGGWQVRGSKVAGNFVQGNRTQPWHALQEERGSVGCWVREGARGRRVSRGSRDKYLGKMEKAGWRVAPDPQSSPIFEQDG